MHITAIEIITPGKIDALNLLGRVNKTQTINTIMLIAKTNQALLEKLTTNPRTPTTKNSHIK